MAVTLCECYFSTKSSAGARCPGFRMYQVLKPCAQSAGLPKPTHRLTGNPCLDFPRRIIPHGFQRESSMRKEGFNGF